MPLTIHDLPAYVSPEFRVPDELLKRNDTALPRLYDWNAKENPNYPLFLYYDPATGKNHYITYSVANEAINRAARYITHTVGRESSEPTGSPVVAILANTGTFPIRRLQGHYGRLLTCLPCKQIL